MHPAEVRRPENKYMLVPTLINLSSLIGTSKAFARSFMKAVRQPGHYAIMVIYPNHNLGNLIVTIQR
jgi:hypothetical protein